MELRAKTGNGLTAIRKVPTEISEREVAAGIEPAPSMGDGMGPYSFW